MCILHKVMISSSENRPQTNNRIRKAPLCNYRLKFTKQSVEKEITCETMSNLQKESNFRREIYVL